MKLSSWMLALLLPFVFLLTTGESCNCQLDETALQTANEQLASLEKSKQTVVRYRPADRKAPVSIPADCKCMYTGEELEKLATDKFGANSDDPLMLTPLTGTDKVPTFDPRKRTFTELSAYMGCISCSGITGGGKRPPPPPPPTGDEAFLFGKITAALIGPDPSIGSKSDYLEINLLNKSQLGGREFSDLRPQDAWSDKVGGQDAFVSNRNGYTVAVIDLGSGDMLRIGSFDSDRVQNVLANFEVQ